MQVGMFGFGCVKYSMEVEWIHTQNLLLRGEGGRCGNVEDGLYLACFSAVKFISETQ